MSKTNIPKFLMSAFNMVKRGDIKSLDDLFKFAKQEFGEITSSLKNQIEDIFKKGQAAAVTEKRTKDISMGDPTGEKREGLISLNDELKEKLKDYRKTQEEIGQSSKGMFDDIFDAMIGFRRPTGSKDKAKPFQTPGMPYKKENPGYRTLGGSMYAEGNLRTAMREFLKTEVKEGRLKLNEQDLFRITEYSPLSADDPIDVFRRYYGEDALEAADAMASKLEKGTSFKNYEEIFRANMPELKIKTEGAGQYDQSIIDAESALKQAAEDEKNLKKLEEFDVEGRTKNSKGGINRVGFARGKIKLAQFFYAKGTDLFTEIRKAVNNIFESGDRKIDADVAVDDMLDEFGIDRDVVDQKDILEAYDEAYKTLSIPPGSRGGPDDIAAPVQSAEDTATSIKRNKDKQKVRKEMKEKYGFTDERLDEIENTPVDEEMADRLIAETDLPKNDLVSRQIKIMNAADRIKPGLFENITEEQIDILVKYADRIDDDLLKNIVLDPDPNNRAAAVATLEQVDALMSEGKNIDEIMSILQSTPRRKQAEGGLSYLMGM